LGQRWTCSVRPHVRPLALFRVAARKQAAYQNKADDDCEDDDKNSEHDTFLTFLFDRTWGINKIVCDGQVECNGGKEAVCDANGIVLFGSGIDRGVRAFGRRSPESE
jgi:hypothetical protein